MGGAGRRAAARVSSSSAAAASVETIPRRRVTSPRPSGWRRFDRNTTHVPLDGSIQSDVPVKPVCPKEPYGKRSPRFRENALATRSEEHTSELQSQSNLVCRLLLEKKNQI